MPPTVPLIKALTEAGIGSRRRMADAIKQGKVEVNNSVAESFNHPVDLARDRVYLNGQRLDLKPEKPVCLMLNKPEGIVSTVSDEKGRPTVLDIVPEKYKKHRLYPVGRLDIDTTGLLLLTNDGDLTYRLTHPRFEQDKEYLVQIEGKLAPEELRRLEEGLLLEDGMTAPAAVKKLRSGTYNYRIIIHEGRKRQVRRMFEHIGYPVKALKRVRIGNLSIGDLEEGTTRLLTSREFKELTGKPRLPAARAAKPGKPPAKPLPAAVKPSRPAGKPPARPGGGAGPSGRQPKHPAEKYKKSISTRKFTKAADFPKRKRV